MSYRGRYRLGDHVPLFMLTHDANGTPTAPSDPPLAVVWKGNTKLTTFRMPITERYVQTGTFAHFIRLGEDYAVGPYSVIYHYTAGSYVGLDQDDFEIVEGGDPDGAVIALHFLQRPQAGYLVAQFDSGRLWAGRNPRV